MFQLAAALASLVQAVPAVLKPEARADEEVVVTARRDYTPPDPFALFRQHCFDANRLTGRSAPPGPEQGWFPLDPDLRTRRGLAADDAATSVWDRVEERGGVAMSIQVGERKLRRRLVERRCVLTTAGKHDAKGLVDRVSRMMGGAGSRKHISLDADEVRLPRLPGWTQWRWTGAPAPSSQVWKSYRSGSLLLVVADFFYDRQSYLVIDLKFRDDPAKPASVLTLVHIFDPTVFTRGRDTASASR